MKEPAFAFIIISPLALFFRSVKRRYDVRSLTVAARCTLLDFCELTFYEPLFTRRFLRADFYNEPPFTNRFLRAVTTSRFYNEPLFTSRTRPQASLNA